MAKKTKTPSKPVKPRGKPVTRTLKGQGGKVKAKVTFKNEPTSNALKVLTQLIDDKYAEEGLTPELLGAIDLSIAFSPVIAFRGEDYADAVEVIPTEGGLYLVRHPLITYAINAEVLKPMRLRYLLANGEEMEKRWGPVIAAAKSRAVTPAPVINPGGRDIFGKGRQ